MFPSSSWPIRGQAFPTTFDLRLFLTGDPKIAAAGRVQRTHTAAAPAAGEIAPFVLC